MILAVIGLTGLMLVGGTLNTTPIQRVYSSASQETIDEGQQDEPTNGDQPADDHPSDDEPVVEPEPVAEPVDEITPVPLGEELSEDQQHKQQQLTLDIIDANGLVIVNETTTDAIGDGGGSGGPGGPSTTAREVTCVKNSQGQTFCYEVLKPDEHCLKPINVEDPPLCRPPP